MNRLTSSRFKSDGVLHGWPRAAGMAIVVLSSIVVLAGLTGCSSKADYDDLVAERDAAKASNVTLTTENAILRARTPAFASYQDIDRKVELSYPTAWVRRDTQQIFPFFESPEGTVNAGVTSELLPQPMTTYAYFVALNERLEGEGYLLSGVRPIDLGDASGLQAVYMHNGLIQVFVVVVKEQTAWSLIQTTKADEFLDWAQTFNVIASSFSVK